MNTRKKILLGISINHGISQLIEQNLIHCGFDVLNIDPYKEGEKTFKYPSFFSRLKVKFRQIFLKDKQAKLKLQSELLQKKFEDQIKDQKFDYALFFLAQNFSLDFIHYIRKRVNKGGMVNYQWDGMNRYPLIYDRLKFFDRVFVFDPDDVDIANNLLPTTSFYFDNDIIELPIEHDFYFLGTHIDDRYHKIVEFANFADKQGWKLNFQIFCPKGINRCQGLYPSSIVLFDTCKTKSYPENLQISRRSKVLVDFVISTHKGLSLRTFEALAHDKKLITTNKEIKKYDFYHPNNIFVLDDNLDKLTDFLNKEYIKIDPKIKEKYGFSNWIKYVLDINPHQKISLP
ncbi:hypothetical protein ACPEER_00125 [Pasteurella sp. PK-2025]|uniref:hypothetical protein n=1 Tax=Pasteurella sp. PK-2025 TaxID=3413133 RepID=UPI003C73524C